MSGVSKKNGPERLAWADLHKITREGDREAFENERSRAIDVGGFAQDNSRRQGGFQK